MISPKRLTAAQLNGISAAVGVALTQILIAGIFGSSPGLAAVGGAVCASLPDVPNPPQRAWPRVVPAALASALVTLLVGLAHGALLFTILLVAVVGLLSLMALAWGARAGPLSFAPILAMVFAMAWGPLGSFTEVMVHAGWVLCGGLVYALWARASAWVLRRRYRDLALASALRATERRLRSRAQRITGAIAPEQASIRVSIADDVLLADALQSARDQVFAARRSAHSRRQTDIVLGLIELRDLLLASRLDTELLGNDAAGRQWRGVLATMLLQLADALAALADATDRGRDIPQLSAAAWRAELARRLVEVQVDEDDARHHLVAALQARLGHMLDDVAAMAARLRQSDDAQSPWSRESLQPFVSPEGWPLGALRPHLSLNSGVARHALRSSLALAFAYALGHVLPWAAHPYWLMLSVAVVLRGNLEQTLSRRNERIIGTVIGCLLVLVLAQVHDVRLLSLAFIMAVGTAHAYINVRYRVAATGATLMALLQPLMLHPGTNPAVFERLADTVMGAGLAWAFSFVLPSWEKASLERISRQLRGALAKHASNMLRWQPSPAEQLSQRLSRQQAYAALSAFAGVAQRTLVEPQDVRLPDAGLEAVLSHGYRLMALLGAVQHLVGRRGKWLDEAQARAALREAQQQCVAILRHTPSAALSPWPEQLDADAGVWPEHLGQADLTPWLLRRLRICQSEAAALVEALEQLSRPAPP